MSTFPIDLGAYQRISLDASVPTLTAEQKAALQANIQLCRDAIVFFTSTGAARGVGGHTGGPFDTVPEVMIMDALFRGSDKYVPTFFDEAGHRVATQYLMSVLNGDMPAEKLTQYRAAHSHLPGHPELGFTPGVKFSSGRLGHMWPYVNGVAIANPEKVLFCLGSDGSQQEGDDAEAARLAVAQGLNVKLIIDDNDVTIAGHPSSYLKGCSTAKTLAGQGVTVLEGDGEDLDSLYANICTAINTPGPVAVINHRKMCPGIVGLEGSTHGHDVISVKVALEYLENRGHTAAVEFLKGVVAPKMTDTFLGSDNAKWDANRNVFGDAVVAAMSTLTEAERIEKVRVIDSDLEGSCGLHKIHAAYPESFISSGIMERGNFSAAAGFGMEAGKQGIFGTFAAFLEMLMSEITMARLNNSNVLSHFSHSGIDDMADNTCHFGLNNFFADNGLDDAYATGLYFPADPNQMRAVVKTIFFQPGLRFVFSTRSKTPIILNDKGEEYFGGDYTFVPGKDEVIREGTAGYVIAFGETLYRALDAVERLKAEGIDVGLINKPTLTAIDEDMLQKVGSSPMVLVVESFNRKTGLGSRYGSWLLERGLTPKFGFIATHKEGCGGLWEQFPHQGIDPNGIMAKVKAMLA
ncbi:transketolase C-terminal domain-containing protein [Methylosoma difficile]